MSSRRLDRLNLQRRPAKETAMGKIVVTEFVTLDGVFEDPGGSEGTAFGGWAFKADRSEAGDKFKGEELEAAEAQLLGRVTYEGFAQAWPERSGDWFSDKFNQMPKYVFSSTLQTADWNNSHIISGDLAEEMDKLKQQVEGDVLVAGSGQLVQGLLKADLVDELRLMVFPIVAGQGRRLLDGAPANQLKLADTGKAGDTVTAVYTRQ
jgi:dihydrofolate reductase